ncbi:MAG: ion channel [Bacteroidales bacterium]|jgi:voltage-gated potassium channel
MAYKDILKLRPWIEINRFQLLLLATGLVLILPAFTGGGFLSELLFVACLSFLFIQSMIVAYAMRRTHHALRAALVAFMVIIFWLDPAGVRSHIFDMLQLMLLVLFFIFVTSSLITFIRRSKEVDLNVILAAINIYLLMGIVTGSLAFLLYMIYPAGYNFPDQIPNPDWVTFTYYSFITMLTVGYGDITPAINQTQTLAYLTALVGQLYIAIIIAILVGKFMAGKTH